MPENSSVIVKDVDVKKRFADFVCTFVVAFAVMTTVAAFSVIALSHETENCAEGSAFQRVINLIEVDEKIPYTAQKLFEYNREIFGDAPYFLLCNSVEFCKNYCFDALNLCCSLCFAVTGGEV